ncbi:hypothetical protein L0668_13175 [Paraglaciecola aquimarina]|uniref:Uncharacterized protein n=1 Tax=Paraglaciecola algarum TaxID=3050085 RepID=A0ABS9D9K4_9ALTE|nr:hypothetical protein [Paraglaciecola sp. G1-23]MCF2949067.1 hypothetical protein [Paraglaciecola sp. G1-23]
MSENQLTSLQQEWTTLQNQFDSYEKYSLMIKLFNILVTCCLVFVLDLGCWAIFVCAMIWLQDGIWKTFQARMGERLEQVENALAGADLTDSSTLGMQFNSAWAESRKGALGLIAEYIKQSLKPTVAYPHVLLIIMILAQCFLLLD